MHFQPPGAHLLHWEEGPAMGGCLIPLGVYTRACGERDCSTVSLQKVAQLSRFCVRAVDPGPPPWTEGYSLGPAEVTITQTAGCSCRTREHSSCPGGRYPGVYLHLYLGGFTWGGGVVTSWWNSGVARTCGLIHIHRQVSPGDRQTRLL